MAVNEKKLLVIIVVIGFAFRILAALVLKAQPESDYAAYYAIAVNFLSGKGLSDGINDAFYNVGYPLFILAPIFSVFGANLVAAWIGNAVLGAASIVICYEVAKQMGAGKAGRLTAAVLFALYIPSWTYTGYLAKENLMTPLLLGVIWCALLLQKHPTLKFAVALGLLFGLIGLTGNAGFSFAGAALVALTLSPVTSLDKLRHAACILICTLALLTPWLIRNNQVVGAPVLNTNSGFNLYLGNNSNATGYFISIADTPRGATWHDLRLGGELHASEMLRHEAISWMKEHPLDFISLSVKKAFLFWLPPIHKGKGPGSIAESMLRLLWLVQFSILAFAAAATLFLKGLRNRFMLVPWTAIMGYTAVHMIYYVNFRYREPLMPVLCILAAIFMEYIGMKLTQRRKEVHIKMYKGARNSPT